MVHVFGTVLTLSNPTPVVIPYPVFTLYLTVYTLTGALADGTVVNRTVEVELAQLQTARAARERGNVRAARGALRAFGQATAALVLGGRLAPVQGEAILERPARS